MYRWYGDSDRINGNLIWEPVVKADTILEYLYEEVVGEEIIDSLS